MVSLIKQVAELDKNVLILGESGTGKEVAARALHQFSARNSNAFVRVDCTAINDATLQGDLFGGIHDGQFEPGIIESAQEGTIFFDEIAALSAESQLKLLSFIERKEYWPMQSKKAFKADMRIIAATNTDIGKMVREEKFREDLAFRLRTFSITAPPLRERIEDIPELSEHFLREFERYNNRKHKIRIGGAVMKVFMKYSWPGNIRQLKNIIEYAGVICENETVRLDDLPDGFPRENPAVDIRKAELPEKQEIIEALSQSRWHKTKAAEMLGISRSTLYRKMFELNINKGLG